MHLINSIIANRWRFGGSKWIVTSNTSYRLAFFAIGMSLLQNAFYYYVFWCKEKYAIKKWFNHKRYIFLMHFQFNLFISFPFYFSSIMLQLRTQQSLTTQFSRKLDHRGSAFSCYNQVLKTLSEKMWVRTIFLKMLPKYYVISKETICLFLFCFWCHEMGTVRWTFKQFGLIQPL